MGRTLWIATQAKVLKNCEKNTISPYILCHEGGLSLIYTERIAKRKKNNSPKAANFAFLAS